MQHSTEDLILAAHVREIAIALQQQALTSEMKKWDELNPDPDKHFTTPPDTKNREAMLSLQQDFNDWQKRRESHKNEWNLANPVTAYAKKALALITEVADAIR